MFDSCFSGSLFRGAAPIDNPMLVPAAILDLSTKPVRQFITAGTDTQAVPDESIFRKAFVRGLNGEADLNHDGFITGSELGMYLREGVANYSSGKQTPRFEKISDPDLDIGDFVFSSPKTARAPVAGSAEASESKPPKAVQAEDKPDGPTSQGEVLWKTTTDKGLQLSVSEGWVGTGIQVKTGEEVRMSASGSFDLGAFGSSGPEGVMQNDPKKPLPGCQTGAVIAKVGNVLTCARNSNKFTSSQTGELYLSINESNYSDNSGSVNIRIEILSPFKSK